MGHRIYYICISFLHTLYVIFKYKMISDFLHTSRKERYLHDATMLIVTTIIQKDKTFVHNS